MCHVALRNIQLDARFRAVSDELGQGERRGSMTLRHFGKTGLASGTAPRRSHRRCDSMISETGKHSAKLNIWWVCVGCV